MENDTCSAGVSCHSASRLDPDSLLLIPGVVVDLWRSSKHNKLLQESGWIAGQMQVAFLGESKDFDRVTLHDETFQTKDEEFIQRGGVDRHG